VKYIEKGFLINRIPYSETSTIIRCFTQNHGLKSFMYQGAKKKSGHLLMAMAPIEFSVYQRNDSQLGKMTDAQLMYTFQEIRFHPVKSGIIFFKAEMLQNVLHEDVKDTFLFDFILNELKWLEQASIYTNYPIYWILQLSQYLGFYPLIADPDGIFFDLEEGQFVKYVPSNHTSQQGETVSLLKELISHSKEEVLAWEIPKKQRKKLLNLLFDYFKIHVPNFKELKSIEIIESIWV
jgi:DNA repair protein RecO (recombination protein O)